MVAIQLSGPEILLRAARPERPYPAAALRVGAMAGACMKHFLPKGSGILSYGDVTAGET
jgi:hypothetical protein